MSNILITGATGFFGSNLLVELLSKRKNKIYVLIRPKNGRLALSRKKALIKQIVSKKTRRRAISQVALIKGDITSDNLGLDKKNSQVLRNTIDTIYHCAAIREFDYTINNIRKVNVKGTENLLKLALDWKKNGCLENVNHISTAYVAGNYKNKFYENQVDVSQKFNNTYEQSKFEAEMVVSKYRKKGVPVDIYRPSIITDTCPPDTTVPSGALQLLALFTLEIFKKLPADKHTKFNVIHVNIASKAIHLISTTNRRALNQTYHIVNPRPVRLVSLFNTACDFFKFKKPKYISPARFRMDDFTPVQKKILRYFLPYLSQGALFGAHNTLSILNSYGFKIPPINKESMLKSFLYYRSSDSIPNKKLLCY